MTSKLCWAFRATIPTSKFEQLGADRKAWAKIGSYVFHALDACASVANLATNAVASAKQAAGVDPGAAGTVLDGNSYKCVQPAYREARAKEMALKKASATGSDSGVNDKPKEDKKP